MNYLAGFQQAPAETTTYMIAGYAVIFGLMAIYLASLWVRRRNLNQELELLDEIANSESSLGENLKENGI